MVWLNHTHTHTHTDLWSLLTCGKAEAGRESIQLLCFVPVLCVSCALTCPLVCSVSVEDGAACWRADKCCCSTAQAVAKSSFVSSQIWTLCDTDNTETKSGFLLICAFYDVNCLVKVLWDLEIFFHLTFVCLCGCTSSRSAHLLFWFSIFYNPNSLVSEESEVKWKPMKAPTNVSP